MSSNNFYGKENSSKAKLSKCSTDNSVQHDDNNNNNNHIKSSEALVLTLPINGIKINEEYSKLVYQLSKSDYEILKESIKENGLYTPIVINRDGIILDGHHRYKACEELGILDKLRVEVREFGDPLLEKKFIYEINHNRRHLNAFQRIELRYREELIEAELAKKRTVEAGKLGAEKRWWNKGDDYGNDKVVQNYTTQPQQQQQQIEPGTLSDNKQEEGGEEEEYEKGRVIDVAAKKSQVSPMTYFKAREIIKQASEEDKEKLRSGKTKIEKIYRQLQKQKKREELVNAPSIINLPENVRLIHGDFRDKSEEIPDNSIDLIFADPPYKEEFLPLYNNLAQVATRVLKSGGSLVIYLGQYALPEILDMMKITGLTYWWIFAVKHAGATSTMWREKVFVGWKPLLWFFKGGGDDDNNTTKPNVIEYISDYIESKPPEKIMHDWEQSVVEADHVISKLTVDNQTVFDPMMGSATTAEAALKLGRKFIGIEKEVETFERASARISQLLQSLQNNQVNNGEDEDNSDTVYQKKKNKKEEEY